MESGGNERCLLQHTLLHGNVRHAMSKPGGEWNVEREKRAKKNTVTEQYNQLTEVHAVDMQQPVGQNSPTSINGYVTQAVSLPSGK